MKNVFKAVFTAGCILILGGCGSSGESAANVMLYKVVSPEPEWIRNGEPVEFESDLWYPLDTVDVLLDSEVVPVGTYRDVEIFTQRLDVRPYSRVYTKFGKNKFRVFESKSRDDQSRKAF